MEMRRSRSGVALATGLMMVALTAVGNAAPKAGRAPEKAPPPPATKPAPQESKDSKPAVETAVLAGGCFWGMEEILRNVPGVLSTEAGYTGGDTFHPRSADLHTGGTRPAEPGRITFDPPQLSYPDPLHKRFFPMHDPP